MRREFVPLSGVKNNEIVWSLVNADIVGGIVPERKIGGRGRKGAEVRADHSARCDHLPGNVTPIIAM